MVKEMIAQQLGEDLIKADASLYSQHIKGTLNIIADILSWSKLSADKLLNYLQETYCHLLPENFWIVEIRFNSQQEINTSGPDIVIYQKSPFKTTTVFFEFLKGF